MALQLCESDCEKAKQMFYQMYLSRSFQSSLKKVGGKCVSDLGEEAISVGTVYGLREDDIISCYFRGDAASLRIRGGYSFKDYVAGWLYRKGEKNPDTYAYPNSWFDLEHGIIGTTSSLIGADAVICTGAALAQKIKGTDNVVLFLSGDGATSKGEFYEMTNFAKLQKLPLIIFIRNNNYAMSTTMDRNVGYTSFHAIPDAFGIPYKEIDGNDVLEVAKTVAEVAEEVRAGNGPYVIIAKSFRMAPHTIDDGDEYREDVDRSYWKEHDPLKIMEKHLKDSGVDTTEIDAIKNKCQADIDEAIKWVMNRPEIELKAVTDAQQAVVDKMWRINE